MSAAERIRELSTINADVPAMLSAAGNAVSALTNRAVDSEQDGVDEGADRANTSTSVDARKEAFTGKAREFLTLVQSISALLRRQAYALEEAGINAAEAPVISTTASFTAETAGRPAGVTGGMARRGAPGVGGSAMPQRQAADDADRVTNGGLGNLDVGLLNSRGNSVGIEKEAELSAEAKDLLKGLVRKTATLSNSTT